MKHKKIVQPVFWKITWQSGRQPCQPKSWMIWFIISSPAWVDYIALSTNWQTIMQSKLLWEATCISWLIWGRTTAICPCSLRTSRTWSELLMMVIIFAQQFSSSPFLKCRSLKPRSNVRKHMRLISSSSGGLPLRQLWVVHTKQGIRGSGWGNAWLNLWAQVPRARDNAESKKTEDLCLRANLELVKAMSPSLATIHCAPFQPSDFFASAAHSSIDHCISGRRRTVRHNLRTRGS